MKTFQVQFLIFTAATLLVVDKAFAVNGDDVPSAEKDGGVDRMKKNLIALYDALHHFALPDVDVSKPVSQRFILQVPGKILNPMEYYPGKKYEEYLEDPHNVKEDVQIPPMVMEKMFQLSDVIPNAHPLTGGESGYSLARIYERILGTMDVVSFAEMTKVGKDTNDEAMDKLLEPLSDPDNPSDEVPLLQLYSRFRDAYYDQQQQMEKNIKDQKETLTAMKYQLWFQRHFRILNAKVEGAYTQWLLYGRKHLVESYIAHFDITSSGAILESARIDLRSSGVISLDRSQTVYPVSFTPSNWFKYLNPKQAAPLTRDQLHAKLQDVKTRITMLEAMRDASSTELDENDMAEVKKAHEDKEKFLQQSMKTLEESRKTCWLKPGESCDIQKKEEEVATALSESSSSKLNVEMLEFQFGANAQMKGQIDVVLEKLKDESEQLKNQLEESKPSSGSPLVEDVGKTEALQLEEIQDDWAVFEFSSTKSSKETTAKGMKSTTSTSVGTIFRFVPKTSVSASVGRQSFSEHVKSASLKVKAKLLKVKINRPWFRPDLFRNREFKLQRSGVHVSPGYMPEKSFYDKVSSDGSTYLLYQYPTAFLLAKEVTMEFGGLDAKTKQKALTSSFGVSSKGSFGPISFGGSTSTSGSYSNMQASSTADGLKIDIPGAQLIGYYCDVVPKFPNPIVSV